MRFNELRYTVKSNNASLCANLSHGEHLNCAAEGRAPVWGLSGERVRFGRHSAHTVRMTDRQVYYGHVKPNETRARECVKIARERVCALWLLTLSVCAMRTRRTHDLSNIIALSHWNAIILLSAMRQGGGLRCGRGAQVEISKLKTPSRADSQTATLRIIYIIAGVQSRSRSAGGWLIAQNLFLIIAFPLFAVHFCRDESRRDATLSLSTAGERAFLATCAAVCRLQFSRREGELRWVGAAHAQPKLLIPAGF